MHPKVCLLSTKTMPKHFLNNSKKTLKKARKWLFRPRKLSKMTPQNRQNEPNWHSFFGYFARQKSHFLAFFKGILELFGKCLGIFFGLKRLAFGCIWAISYTLYYPYLLLSFGVPRSPNKCRQGFTRTTSFLDYFKVFMDLFWKFLSLVFGHKKPLKVTPVRVINCFSSETSWKPKTQPNRSLVQFFGFQLGLFADSN